jgi:hypothetical protein
VAARWIRLLFVLVVCFGASRARAELRVDLITVEPGEALYERFGHTALPFSDPRFLWKFARGEGEFLVIEEPYATTLARYRDSDRTLMRQRLLLPHPRAVELALRLKEAASPPRNRYLYDQLYDNCATRVRDLIDRVSERALTRAASKHASDHRYRDDTLSAMAGHPIGHWALDLIGGRHQDLPVTSFHEMYLPVALRDRLAEAELVVEGRRQRLAEPPEIVFERQGPPRSRAIFRARQLMLAAALSLSALALAFARAPSRARRRVAALALGLCCAWSALFGALAVPLTLLSHVHNFSPNENAWLFWPTDVLLVPALYRGIVQGQQPGRPFVAYVAAKGLCLVLLLVLKAFGVWTQHNLVFVALALLFSLPLAQFTWPDRGWLARSLRAKRSGA